MSHKKAGLSFGAKTSTGELLLARVYRTSLYKESTSRKHGEMPKPAARAQELIEPNARDHYPEVN